MNKTIEQYKEWEPLELPAVHADGFSLEEVSVLCAECRREGEDLRGEVEHHARCLEVKFAGACYECNLVTFARMRWYGDGRLMHWRDDEINTYEPKPSLLERVGRFFKNL